MAPARSAVVAARSLRTHTTAAWIWGGAEKEKDEVIHKRLDCYFIFSAVNNNVTFHLCEAADCQQRLQEQWFVLRKARHEGFCMEPVRSHTYISVLTDLRSETDGRFECFKASL